MIEIKQSLIAERGELCECGCGRKATEVHHCLIHTMKKYHNILTCEENCMLLARECHSSGEWNSYEGRVKFWGMQCKRYGKKHMILWLENLPLIDKPKF
jgi:hypothetical protein